MANFKKLQLNSGSKYPLTPKKLQLSLILRVAGKIWQILQITAVICRILQIPPGSANCKPKFLSKKLAKVCSQKILQSRRGGSWGSGVGG